MYVKKCTPVFITALSTIARTWKQPRCTSTDEWMQKLWYICTMEYYSAIKKYAFKSVLMRWMKLEPIIQSEVSWKQKDKYCILTHVYRIQKDGIDEPIFRAAMETQTSRTDLWAWLGGGEERIVWKHIHYHRQNREHVGICCVTHGPQLSAL